MTEAANSAYTMHPMLAHNTVSAPANDTPTMSFNGPVTPETLTEAIIARAHYLSVDEIADWLYRQRAAMATSKPSKTMMDALDIQLVAIHTQLAEGGNPNREAAKLADKVFALGLV